MKQKLNELQVYSGIAILFVVLIHTNFSYLHSLQYYYKYSDIRWMFYYLNPPSSSYTIFPYFFNLIDKITHVAVPLFIFIAGFKYSYTEQHTYASYFSKKMKRIFKPFIIISIFFILLNFISSLIYKNTPFINLLINSVKSFIKIFLGINAVTPLWYIPMYLLIVLSYPIIIKFIKNDYIRFTIFSILGLIWVLADLFIPFIKSNQLPFCFIYYFFIFEMGVIFEKKQFKNKNGIPLIYIYLLLIFLSIFIKNEQANIAFTEIILTPFAVIAFYYLSLKLKDCKFLFLLGKYSFYIFLFHEPIIEQKLSHLLLIYLSLNNFYPIILFIALITIFISILFYKFLEKTHISKIIL